MAVTLTQEHDPYIDGLGKSSDLGVFFLRRITIDLNAFATSYALAIADLGVQKIVRTVSIVPKSNHTVYQSAQSSVGASITYTASANTAVFDVFVLCQGL